MTSYNYADYIKEAIESVLAQTYTNWELVIVDDGSTDNSVDVIKSYIEKDDRIKLFQHENNQNKGLASSIKLGIEKSESEWIAFLESDDKFTQNSIEEKMNAIQENPNIDLLFTDLELFQDTKIIPSFNKYFDYINSYFFDRSISQFIYNFPVLITKMNFIPTFSVVILKKSIIENCDFSPTCKASVDYYLWAQLSKYNIYYLNKKLTDWRIHSNSYINTDRHNWFVRCYFYLKIYYFTIADKNLLLKILLMLNYIRTRIVYVKFDKTSIKINIANHKYIFEKKLK